MGKVSLASLHLVVARVDVKEIGHRPRLEDSLPMLLIPKPELSPLTHTHTLVSLILAAPCLPLVRVSDLSEAFLHKIVNMSVKCDDTLPREEISSEGIRTLISRFAAVSHSRGINHSVGLIGHLHDSNFRIGS